MGLKAKEFVTISCFVEVQFSINVGNINSYWVSWTRRVDDSIWALSDILLNLPWILPNFLSLIPVKNRNVAHGIREIIQWGKFPGFLEIIGTSMHALRKFDGIISTHVSIIKHDPRGFIRLPWSTSRILMFDDIYIFIFVSKKNLLWRTLHSQSTKWMLHSDKSQVV